MQPFKVSQLPKSIRGEVEEPLEVKLEKANRILKMYVNRHACVSCSFGKDSMLVLWLALKLNPNIHVVFNNTGIEYPETIKFKERMKKELDLNLIETKPKRSFWQVWKGKQMPDGSKKNKKNISIDRCCYHLKEAPFKRIVREYSFKSNFTGLTVMESRQRMMRVCQLGNVYYNKTNQLWRTHLIAFWTPEEIWKFTRKNNIPINPAYDKYGLNRLGCMFCTAHKGWREEVSRINPKVYKYMIEHYFNE